MAKHMNTCAVCGTSWSSVSPSNDCGKVDQAHLIWRGVLPTAPPPKPPKDPNQK